MKYIGSKRRIAKDILPIILKDRQPGQWYVEPFVGGANLIDKVDGLRLGADNHYYLICYLTAIRDGWLPPTEIKKDLYYLIKHNKDKFAPELVGFAGFNCAFAGTWGRGYASDKIGANYATRGHKNARKQAPNLKGVEFVCCDYKDLIIPDNSIIYCDPPYEGATQYYASDSFNHNEFWQWCRGMALRGHQIFVSEYRAPDDFKCVWQKEIRVRATNKGDYTSGIRKAVEKLFIPQTQE